MVKKTAQVIVNHYRPRGGTRGVPAAPLSDEWGGGVPAALQREGAFGCSSARSGGNRGRVRKRSRSPGISGVLVNRSTTYFLFCPRSKKVSMRISSGI